MVIVMVTNRQERWNRSRSLETMKPPPARQAGGTGLGVHLVGWMGRGDCKAYLGEGTHKDGW